MITKQKYNTNAALIKGLIFIAGFSSHREFADHVRVSRVHLSRIINGSRYSKSLRLAITNEIKKCLLKRGIKNIQIEYQDLWPGEADEI